MADPALQDHFATPERQKEAAQLGMWVYLATEVLLFAGLFVAYGEYRMEFGQGFRDAGRHVMGWLGLILTFILLTSSFSASMAVDRSRKGRMGATAGYLVVTIVLGVAFLALHLWEWHHHASEGALPGEWYHFREATTQGANLFFTLYYLMTGLHMLHVTVGIGLLVWITSKTALMRFSARYQTPIEIVVLYWHLVDLIWQFLFPTFYLVNRR